MEITNVSNVHEGKLVVQKLEVDGAEVERIKFKQTFIGICHDPVNDTVMLVKDIPFGSLMETTMFPTHTMRCSLDAREFVREISKNTGATIKSAKYLQGFMGCQEFAYAPYSVYYVTFDSRTVAPNDSIILTSGKELWNQVADMRHHDIGVILGAHYLKMLQNNLIK